MRELEPELDPATLHEAYADVSAAQDRAATLREQLRAAPDEIAEFVTRGDLVDVLRCLGDLDEALAEGQSAVDRAVIAGTPAQQHLARVRLATVRQWRGEFGESNLAFTELGHAAGQFGPVVAAFTHDRAGRNAFDQADFAAAHDHFTRALALRQEFELPAEEIASARVARDAAAKRLQEESR
ncbi:MAG: hypothetical protein M3N95_03585 [Actinomycetota bacterium]|nr:hypothetical protein [Actinomycetota bacterium]